MSSKFAGALLFAAIAIAFSTSHASPLDSPTVQDVVPEMEDYTSKASAATQLRTAETSAVTQLATDEFVTVEKKRRRRRRRRRKASSSPTTSPTTTYDCDCLRSLCGPRCKEAGYALEDLCTSSDCNNECTNKWLCATTSAPTTSAPTSGSPTTFGPTE